MGAAPAAGRAHQSAEPQGSSLFDGADNESDEHRRSHRRPMTSQTVTATGALKFSGNIHARY
jgi:hypothetical protein